MPLQLEEPDIAILDAVTVVLKVDSPWLGHLGIEGPAGGLG